MFNEGRLLELKLYCLKTGYIPSLRRLRFSHAVLSDGGTPEKMGKVFGFQRSMDTLGAVTVISLALICLYYLAKNYKTLFFIAFIPGLLPLLPSFYLKER